MRDIKEYNPITVFIYYMAVVVVSMFTMNPFLHIISFIGGLVQFLIRDRSSHFGVKKQYHQYECYPAYFMVPLNKLSEYLLT